MADGTNIAQGSGNVVTLTATDTMGNTSRVDLEPFTVDRTSPTITVRDSGNREVRNPLTQLPLVTPDDVRLGVRFNDIFTTGPSDIRVTCSLNDTTNGSIRTLQLPVGTFSESVDLTHNVDFSLWLAKENGDPLDQGKYTNTVLHFSDLAGNSSLRQLTTYYVDDQDPTFSCTHQYPESINGLTNNIRGDTDNTRRFTINTNDTSMQTLARTDSAITEQENILSLQGVFNRTDNTITETVFLKREGDPGNYSQTIDISGDIDVNVLVAKNQVGDPLSEGLGTITFRVTDQVGKIGTSTSDSFCFDRTQPQISLPVLNTTGLVSESNDLNPRIQLTIVDNAGTDSSRPLNVDICGHISSSSTHGSLVGKHLLLSPIVDGSHNTAVNPAVTDLSLVSTTNTQTVVYQMTIDDPVSDFSVTSVGSTAPLSEQGVGQYSVVFNVTDSATNTITSSPITFTLDTLAPRGVVETTDQVAPTRRDNDNFGHTNAKYPMFNMTPRDNCSNEIRIDARRGGSGFYNSDICVGLHVSTTSVAQTDLSVNNFSNTFISLTPDTEYYIYMSNADGLPLPQGNYPTPGDHNYSIHIRLVDDAAYNTSITGGDMSLNANNTKLYTFETPP